MLRSKEVIRKLVARHRNLILYGIIGSSGAIIDFISFLLLFNLVGVDPLLATTLSTSLGIVNNFFLNVRFNFKVKDKLWHRFAVFYAVGFSGLLLSVLFIFLLHDVLGLNANVAKAITIPVIVLTQYLINSRLSFADKIHHLTFQSLLRVLKVNWIDILLGVLVGAAFITSSYLLGGMDELDNLLSGKLIAGGGVPYRDFFSHHTPGMYYLAALIQPFTGNDFFAFRVVVNVLTLSLAVCTYFLLRKRFGLFSARLWLVFAGLSHVVGFGHTALAESVAVFFFLISLLLIVFDDSSGLISRYKPWIISICLFGIPFFSLSYVFVAGILYVVLIARALRNSVSRRISSIAKLLIILATPWLLYLAYLVYTGSLKDFVFNNLTFNTLYYAPLVSDQSSGILQTILGAVIGSIRQVATVLANLLNPGYATQIVLLSPIVAAIIFLAIRRRWSYLATLIALLLFINPRSDIFNQPAMTTPISSISQHGIFYVALSLLVASLLIPQLFKLSKRITSYPGWFLRIGGLLLTITIVATLSYATVRLYNDVFIAKTSVNNYTQSHDYAIDNLGLVARRLAGPEGKAWVGPADFHSQLYLDDSRSTGFTFYMPWIDACPSCRQAFISDLRTEDVSVVVWSGYTLKDAPYQYSAEVTGLLDTAYFQVRDPRLKNFYFLNEKRDDIEKEMRTYGYQI